MDRPADKAEVDVDGFILRIAFERALVLRHTRRVDDRDRALGAAVVRRVLESPIEPAELNVITTWGRTGQA